MSTGRAISRLGLAAALAGIVALLIGSVGAPAQSRPCPDVTQGPPPRAGNHSPQAAFTVKPNPAATGETVTFDGSATSDPDGDRIAEWCWDFGDGDGAPHAGGQTETHAYAAAGDYTARLIVSDGAGGMGSATVAVHVSGGAAGGGGGSGGGGGQPSLTISLRIGDRTPRRGARVRFSGLASDGRAGAVVAIQRRLPGGRFHTVAHASLTGKTTPGWRFAVRLRILRSATYRARLGLAGKTAVSPGVRVRLSTPAHGATATHGCHSGAG
jgi:PKD repeat protein